MKTNISDEKIARGVILCVIAATFIFLVTAFTNDLATFGEQPLITLVDFEITNIPEQISSTDSIQVASHTAHLFGVPIFTEDNEIETLPETSLSLKLSGTFTSDQSKGASALVIDDNGGENAVRYFVGDQLPGNAELISVHADSIVIRRNFQDERLKMPRFGDIQTGPELMYPDRRVFLNGLSPSSHTETNPLIQDENSPFNAIDGSDSFASYFNEPTAETLSTEKLEATPSTLSTDLSITTTENTDPTLNPQPETLSEQELLIEKAKALIEASRSDH